MAERDYALEMWRLLDPDSNLINLKELLDRIVCVKSGSRKSLFNVFQDGLCHPKMALVIDDRLKVWDEKDQPRVHVVPAFAPYYSPQAEANNAIPVLCVARNVACNVRGVFFKEFDEGLLQRIPEIAYEDDVKDIPFPPDVSNYLVSEDDSSVSNGNRDSLSFDGMADAEEERRMKDTLLASSTVSPVVTHPDPRLAPPLQHAMASSSASVPLLAAQAPIVPISTLPFTQAALLIKPLSHIGHPESSLQSSPAREEGEVPESELDPDTRRRLLILQHGQDTRGHAPSEPPFPARPPMQVSVPHTQPRGSWLPAEEEMSPRQLNRAVPKEFALDSEMMHIEKHRSRRLPFFPKVENSIPSGRVLHENQRLPKERLPKDDRLRLDHTLSNHSLSGEETLMGHSSSSNRYLEFESRRAISGAETPAGVLQDIAMKCGTKVEFKSALVASKELHFSVEAWFAGEKVGEGIGRTRREAQCQAAEGSIKNLANIYMSRVQPDTGSPIGDVSRFPFVGDNGFSGNASSFGNQVLSKEESASFCTASEPYRLADPRLQGLRKSTGAVSALKELCMMEGLGLAFQAQSPPSANMHNNEVHAQVEIDGQVLGKGTGSTWKEAKIQAADKALGSLRSMLGQYSQKRQGSPRCVIVPAGCIFFFLLLLF
ncbi:C-terminal domain phosphatase-like 1 isoform 2 [Tripterygium wilfordii]|uniref:C-terminal domain phosphatase-like 1 isoform 2 n=1 Tax=Tripterygium wilfordii TaxID=458696 RepID=A0A7J7C469_TRIWF|nr:C-terminal domain phosphatase-like 1 isoform 2 [Tripterygium wilfordii]